METKVLSDGQPSGQFPGTLDAWSPDGTLNERVARAFTTDADAQELDDYALSFAQAYQQTPQADGSTRLTYDPNGHTMHRVTAEHANQNRGVIRKDDYMALIHETAIHGSSLYDKTNPQRMLDNIFASVWVDGVEDVLQCEKDIAKSLVKDEIRWVLERCGTLDNQEIKDIEARLERESAAAAARFSRVGQAMPLYRAGKIKNAWQINQSEARKNLPLHNIYRYNPGIREAYWRDTKTTPMPPLAGANKQLPDGEWWNEALSFAQWYGDRAEADLAAYKEAWHVSAREEILRRLGAERTRNLDFNQLNAIIRAVVNGQGKDDNSVGYDDNYHWKGVLSPEDVQQAQDARVGEWRARRALPNPEDKLNSLRSDLAVKKQAQKQALDDANALKKRHSALASDTVRGRSWAYDGCDNDDEPLGVRIPAAEYKKLCQDYNLTPRKGDQGDKLIVQLKAGSKTLYFPVIGTHSDSDDILLNARAVGSLRAATNGRRGKYAKTNWYTHTELGADIKYHFKRSN